MNRFASQVYFLFTERSVWSSSSFSDLNYLFKATIKHEQPGLTLMVYFYSTNICLSHKPTAIVHFRFKTVDNTFYFHQGIITVNSNEKCRHFRISRNQFLLICSPNIEILEKQLVSSNVVFPLVEWYPHVAEELKNVQFTHCKFFPRGDVRMLCDILSTKY